MNHIHNLAGGKPLFLDGNELSIISPEFPLLNPKTPVKSKIFLNQKLPKWPYSKAGPSPAFCSLYVLNGDPSVFKQ